jgi:hypothetical protein
VRGSYARRDAEAASKADRLRRELAASMRLGCANCWLATTDRGVPSFAAHSAYDCVRLGRATGSKDADRLFVERVKEVQSHFRSGSGEAYSGCSRCGVPQVICASWADKEDGSGGFRRADGFATCQYPGAVPGLLAAYLCRGHPELRRVLVELDYPVEEYDRGPRTAALLRMASRRVVWGAIETSGFCEIFLALRAGGRTMSPGTGRG